MIRLNYIPLICLAFLLVSAQDNSRKLLNTEGSTIETRIMVPQGFDRIKAAENSFSEYLKRLPLKPHGAKVKLYDGGVKENNGVYVAVADLRIGRKDLHQCADAVIRLRAEYLYNQKQYDKIHFNFTSGFRADYSEWMKGNRIVLNGNKASWKRSGTFSNTYQDFWKYMEIIFSYAGTLSLSKELKTTEINDLKIGDIFIQGGSPGHAVIVVDIAANPDSNERIFLLAQSYMPAQEIQVLQNPDEDGISPWYSTEFDNVLHTPEWSFNKSDLKRFK